MKVTRQSATTFICEGLSLECHNPNRNPKGKCNYRVDLRKGRLLSGGDRCPRCMVGKLERTKYLVDVANFEFQDENGPGYVGECACPHGQLTAGPELRKMTKLERGVMGDEWICCHIRAVRKVALNQSVVGHVNSMRKKSA